MNQSRNADPLRFLKKMKSRTPSKQSKQSSRTDLYVSEPSMMVESKLQETVLLKQNCYDANKYYSSKCQKYLKEIGYKKRQSPSFKARQQKKQENRVAVKEKHLQEDSIMKTQEKYSKEMLMSKKKDVFMLAAPEGRELTFKKIDFSDKSQSLAVKDNQRNLEVEIDQFDNHDQHLEGQEYVETDLKPCEICGRKFKEESYAKHVNVCEKVFFKKRKQFSSEKQRSRSKQKKNVQ